jgi:pimeloyl-ACP methyl ester carboxylesterase
MPLLQNNAPERRIQAIPSTWHHLMLSLRRLFRYCLIAIAALVASVAHAEGTAFKVPTRSGITTTLYWEEVPNAKATIFLFPGGGGGFGRLENGKPSSRNFLVRSMQYFLDDGYNVAIFGKPSDTPDLDYPDRISSQHMDDIRATLAFVRTKSKLPVWLIGTSRGSVSVTAAAIAIDRDIEGIVLTSSVVNYKKTGAVPSQNLSAIKVPVLVMHHSRDACWVCPPNEVGNILKGLKNAPIKKQIMVDGGGDPSGDACEALHWHGFIGMEREAVKRITDWIAKPSN